MDASLTVGGNKHNLSMHAYSRKQEEQGDKTEETIEDKERTQRRDNDGIRRTIYRIMHASKRNQRRNK